MKEYKVKRAFPGFDVGETFSQLTIYDGRMSLNIDLNNNYWFEKINKTLSSFKIGDKVRRDLKYYDKGEKGKVFDYEIITKIGVNSDGEIDQINGNMIEGYRLANNEEIQKYY